MREIERALDAAKEVTGSDGQTAAKLMMTRQHLSNTRNGLRSLTPPQAKRLADLIGEDAANLFGKIHFEWKSVAAFVAALPFLQVLLTEVTKYGSNFVYYVK